MLYYSAYKSNSCRIIIDLNLQAEQVTHSNVLSLLLIAPLLFLWAVLPNDAVALLADWLFSKISSLLLELPFSRSMEKEADIVGLELSSKACFDVREAPAFWAKMQLILDVDRKDEEFEIPEYLSTHPSHNSRQEHLTELLPKALERRLTCGCFKLTDPDPLVEFQKLKVREYYHL